MNRNKRKRLYGYLPRWNRGKDNGVEMKKKVRLFLARFMPRTKFQWGLLVALILSASAVGVYAASVPNSFTSGTTAVASEVNDNFDYLAARSWELSGSNLYYNSGNIGIGTTNPTGSKLYVFSDNTTYGAIITNYGSHGVLIQGGDASGNYALNVEDKNGGTIMAVKGNGEVGIGIASPDYLLHVNGTAAGTSWTNLSSREYKENIKKLDESKHNEMLSQLMELDLTTYNYKEEFGGDNSAKLGFIAEEMPKEVLSKDGKGVDLYELLAFTIGAMKAQQKNIEELEARMDSKQ